MTAERSAKLKADFEQQIAAIYKPPDRGAWAKATQMAQQANRQRKHDEFYNLVGLLLKELEVYEGVQRWAIRQRHHEVQSLAEQLIEAVGADFIRLKVAHHEPVR
jgi:hypothetical protein